MTAMIIAETGDFSRFDSADKLLVYDGLYPSTFQSGQLKIVRYIPPSSDDMLDVMSDIEKYINDDYELDTLIRVALIHYHFETIHISS